MLRQPVVFFLWGTLISDMLERAAYLLFAELNSRQVRRAVMDLRQGMTA